MSRRRSFSFPRLLTRPKDDADTSSGACDMADAAHQPSPAHSRSSSGASTSSSPITSTFSTRSHSRWPSSTSSLVSAPDSPLNVNKSALQDVVEDPAERDDDALYDLPFESTDEPLCICDSPNCVHQATPRGSCALPPSTITPEWSPGDDYFWDGELPGSHAPRRGSAHRSAETLTSRLSRHWPYLSNRWKSGRPPTSIHSPKVRSAPSSRSNSLRMPSFRQSSAAMPLDFSQALTPPITPVDANAEANELSGPRGISRPHKPVSIAIPEPAEDPVDRQMTSTPLLPPMMGEHPSQDLAPVQSPLQSPTVATGSTSSLVSTPTLTPTFAAIPTPPLSSKPSLTSFGAARAPHGPKPPTEIPSMSISAETDPWAAKLGHANFHISPEPYFPASCDLQSCKALVDAWAAARTEFMRHAARITEHYGPTSQVYQLTQEKWAETDKQWRQYHDQAKAAAGISDDATALLQPLAETQALSKMPSLEDPQQPSKFPVTNEADFVGPMVKYVKIQPRRSRKPTFLRLFTDPASLLAGARSPFAFKR